MHLPTTCLLAGYTLTAGMYHGVPELASLKPPALWLVPSNCETGALHPIAKVELRDQTERLRRQRPMFLPLIQWPWC